MNEIPVIYVPISVATQLLYDSHPDQVLLAQMDTGRQALLAPPLSHNPTKGAGFSSDLTQDIVVVNILGCNVEGVAVTEVHGYQDGEPVVLDDNGAALRLPSEDPAGVAPAIGGVAKDWIDEPPTGSASIGIWTFKQTDTLGFPPIHGASSVLQLRVASPSTDVVLCSVIDAYGSQVWGNGTICASASVPDPGDYYDTTCDLTATPGPQNVSGVPLTLRLVSGYLFAFLGNVPAPAPPSPPPDETWTPPTHVGIGRMDFPGHHH